MTNTPSTSLRQRHFVMPTMQALRRLRKEWGRKRQKEHEQILGHLESSALMSPFTSHAHLDMQMQYSFDYCQHVSLPYSSQQRGTLFFRTPRKVQVFGVCCEPLSHVSDMDDLADCVRQCGQDVTCVPQLYQDWHYYDWNAFLGQWFSPLAGLGRCYTFRFDRKHPGVMKMKTLPYQTQTPPR